jgi:hypothetical protein
MASDERPANLPNGRWLGDLGLLSAAEAHLVASCRDGVDCVFNKKRPRRATTTNKISAKLLRFLALGGDEAHPVHENGVSIVGGYISGNFDLSSSSVPARITLVNCTFDQEIVAQYAKMPLLYLPGCSVPGLNIQGCHVAGDVYLNKNEKAESQYMSGPFESEGAVNLSGAVIDGVLNCSGGIFKLAPPDEKKVIVAGNRPVFVLNAVGMRVKSNLNVLNSAFEGVVDLRGAEVGSLSDDEGSWPGANLVLDGFRYDRFDGSPTDANARINWLKMQIPEHLGPEFKPQPWEQLAKVLREMGHGEEAKIVAIAKQDQLTGLTKSWLGRWGRRFLSLISGYGHEPGRLAICAAIICLAWTLLYAGLDVGQSACPPGSFCWGNFGRPFAYSLDVILPIDFGLETNGLPTSAKDAKPGALDSLVHFVTGVEILAGWLLAGGLTAIVSGLVKKD